MTRRWTQRATCRFKDFSAARGATILMFASICLLAPRVQAGGSGYNVVVIVNTLSSNSLALANYYCERRGVPPENILRVQYNYAPTDIADTTFTNVLLNPLTNLLATRGLTSQVDAVVLSMDLPYRIIAAGVGVNGVTAALFYGFKTDPRDVFTCPLATNSANSFAGTEEIFRFAKPTNAPNSSFLTTMLTADTLANAMRLVDQGVNSDRTFPTNTALLAKTSLVANNVRYQSFDDAIFNTRLRGNYSLDRTNTDAVSTFTNLLGFQTGLPGFTAASNLLVPGALADSLNSFSGWLLEDSGQTNALEFVRAGAAGSHGTIIEPCNYVEKFPAAENYFYQARGFALAEGYYQSITNPYESVILGDPLAAPFATNGSVSWTGLASNTVLAGTTNLSLQIAAGATRTPLQRVDLFLDGKFLQTVTNLAPRQNNTVTVTLNGHATTYTVPASATIKSVASGVTALLNGAAYQALTKVVALQHGDRLELQSTDTTKSGAQLSCTVTSAIGTASALTTFINPARANFLDTVAFGLRSYTNFGTPTTLSVFSVLVTKTNGSTVLLAVTNTAGNSQFTFVQQLLNLINATASLTNTDGLVAEDAQAGGSQSYFNLRARAPGWGPAGIKADFAATGGLFITPASNLALDENLTDLEPRNHLYLSAGTTNQTLTLALVTTNLPDGAHELAAVAYEGTHVWTQTRASAPVQIKNSALTASLAITNADATTAVEGTFTLGVAASATNITLIELFSAGGLVAAVTNQASTVFNLGGSTFGLGRVPFYAVITDASGQQFRTTNFVTRFVGRESAIPIQIFGPAPVQLLWPGIAGRLYDVLAADAMTNSFAFRETLTASNSVNTFWPETNVLNTNIAQRFYKVRVTP
ncbi:MAG: TIGR03790 family protein [Verrucomicrobia bacterium]|nr:TIGR03790 family protein [Verrucomicrobiota bacterium]